MSLHRPISGRSEDLGPLLRFPCPQCNAIQWFHLKRHPASAHILWFKLLKTSASALHCAKCEYTIDLPDADVKKCEGFLPVAQQFAKGKIDEKQFFAKLADAGFQFLKTFVQSNTTWSCQSCGEESPNTFSSCWNCGTTRKDADPQDPVSDAVKTPYLDQAMMNEGGPFGSMNL